MDAPNDYKLAGMFMIIAGAMNIVYSIFLLVALGCTVLCCAVIAILPLAVGVLELISGIKANKGEQVPNLKTFSILGLVTGCLTFNVITIVTEILVLVYLSKEDVKEFLGN